MSDIKPPPHSPAPIETVPHSPRTDSHPTQHPALVVPLLYCPFASKVNPHVEMADQQTLLWVKRYGLDSGAVSDKRFAALHPGQLAARTTPHADPLRLQLVTDWCSWFFIHDDYCDEGGIGKNPQAIRHLHARFHQVLGGATPEAADIPLTVALHDLWSRMVPLVSAAWQQHFIANMDAFFEAGVWEAMNRLKGEVPPLANYLQMRPFTGGMFAYLDLIEMSESLFLSLEMQHHPTVQSLVTMTANIVSWANDVLSLPKELKQGDIHNLVFSIQHQHHLTVQTAMDRAAHLHNQEVERFIQMETTLPRIGDKESEILDRYTLALCTLIRGSLDWLSTSVRYQVE